MATRKQVKRTVKVAKRTTKPAKRIAKSVEFTNEIYKVIEFGASFALVNTQNKPVAKVNGITKAKMKQAHDENKAIRGYVSANGKTAYKLVDMDEFKKIAVSLEENEVNSVTEAFETHEQLKQFIHEKGMELKPVGLFINELKWKYLIRSAVRGKNIMMVGPTGCGKTLAAQSLVRSLKRPDFYFNLGATQDPRAILS